MRRGTSASRWPSSPVCTASDVPRRAAFARRTLMAGAVMFVPAVLTPAVAASAAEPWWTPLGLRGVAIDAVSAAGKTVLVRTGSGTTMLSDDGGMTYAPVSGNPPIRPPAIVQSGADGWAIDASGRVLHAKGRRA